MKERIIINKQKMKLYNKKALDKLGVIISNENYEITDEDTLVDFIKEQFNKRKLTTNFAGILQELKYCIEFESMPETFQELLFLLEDRLQKMNVMLFDNEETTRIKNEFWIKGIRFSRDNTLSIKYNDNVIPFMWNVSYPLMWEIIKSLIVIKYRIYFSTKLKTKENIR